MLPEEVVYPECPDWARCLDGAVTVCDLSGTIVYMNQRSADQFKKYGGFDLVGKSLVTCHPEPARSKVLQMLASPMDNIYTTEKDGQEKIIIQKPWMEDGIHKGIVEISFMLPGNMPHLHRD